MIFQAITFSDLDTVKNLQPPDWPDIIPYIKLYIESPNCWPIKVISGNELLGIGAAIFNEDTAWLAHIIVNEKYRKQGIGSAIVAELMHSVVLKNIPTQLLIATAIGQPVYEKAGFLKVTDYLFFKREKPWIEKNSVFEIKNYLIKYKQQILELDKYVTTENRRWLLEMHLNSAKLIIVDNQLWAYYLPTLGEGPIISQTEEAGLDLMRLKYEGIDKAVLPLENTTGIIFLLENGFVQVSKGARMIFGKEIQWKPEMIYSRIGGNFG